MELKNAMKHLLITILILLPFTANAATYTQISLEYENLGVFYSERTYQWNALGLNDSNEWVNINSEVDWKVEENNLAGQTHTPVTIDENGLATLVSSWGRVNVAISYPKAVPPKPRYDWLNSILMLLRRK